MTRVRIAELKARLSAYLRRVRRGESLVVLDRETPIAMLQPIDREEDLVVVHRPASPTAFRDLELRKIARHVDADAALTWTREDRS